MSQLQSSWRRLTVVAGTVAAWAAVHGAAWAQADVTDVLEEIGGVSGGSKIQAYVASYALVIICIGLGLLAVCKPARLRERPKGEKYETVGLADMVISKREVPVISVGMRMDEVTRKLGKPKIARRGEDIYRELAQTGQLSEDDAAKEYLIYEHRAGRYELVVLDRRVIQVKTHPKSEES